MSRLNCLCQRMPLIQTLTRQWCLLRMHLRRLELFEGVVGILRQENHQTVNLWCLESKKLRIFNSSIAVNPSIVVDVNNLKAILKFGMRHISDDTYDLQYKKAIIGVCC